MLLLLVAAHSASDVLLPEARWAVCFSVSHVGCTWPLFETFILHAAFNLFKIDYIRIYS